MGRYFIVSPNGCFPCATPSPFSPPACSLCLPAPAARAETSPNADICASTDDAPYSPEQRIAACGALIDTLKDQPQAQAAALVNRGATYWYIDKTDLALADFDRAIALDPNNARAFRERSNAYRSIGQLDKALIDANKAVRARSQRCAAFDYRANVFNNNGQYDRAIADYNEALRLKPDDAQTYMDRGVAYYFKKDYQAAIGDYDQAIKLDPKKSRAYTNRGAAYKKLGRTDQAIADESEAIKLDPLEPEYFDNRGLSYAENGDYDRAIADYNEAIRLSRRRISSPIAATPIISRAITTAPSPITTARSRSIPASIWPTTTAAPPTPRRAISTTPSPITRRRCASSRTSTRQPRAWPKRARSATSAMPRLGQSVTEFDCGMARRAVEKAICSDPDLARLDREIDAAYKAALASRNNRAAKQLRHEQRDFLAERNKSFGNPQYNLKREMELRLAALRGMSAKALP